MITAIEGFRHKCQIHIRFKDVDKMGHVNNANHLTYFEMARMSYFREVVNEKIDWNRQGIILARNEVDYKAPILLEDEVWVHIRTARFGASSFEMEYVITRTGEEGTQVAALGRSVLVCFDYIANAKMPVPPSWKEKTAVFEGWKEMI
ncbi:MAG: thioesterase family protein [Bacteroidia bacterium]